MANQAEGAEQLQAAVGEAIWQERTRLSPEGITGLPLSASTFHVVSGRRAPSFIHDLTRSRKSSTAEQHNAASTLRIVVFGASRGNYVKDRTQVAMFWAELLVKELATGLLPFLPNFAPMCRVLVFMRVYSPCVCVGTCRSLGPLSLL